MPSELPQYCELIEYTKMVIKGYANSLFVIGSHGIGKTYNIIKTLKETKTEYVYRAGKITPLSLYRLFHDFNGKIFFLDDTLSIIRSPDCISVLYAACWSPEDKRVITWNSSRLPEELEPEFEFNGRIIFSLNKIPENEMIETLLSRCLTYRLNLKYDDIIQIMEYIAKQRHEQLKPEERLEIVNFIKENSDESYPVDLRLQQKAELMYLYDKESWKFLLLPQLKAKDRNLLVLKTIVDTETDKKKQIKKFNEITGLGVSSFYRYRGRI